MPNWCTNDLSFSGPDESKKAFLESFYDENKQSFSMNKLHPIPEVLNNNSNSINVNDLKVLYENNDILFNGFSSLNDLKKLHDYDEFVVFGKLISNINRVITLEIDNEIINIHNNSAKQDDYIFASNYVVVVGRVINGNYYLARSIISTSKINSKLLSAISTSELVYNNDYDYSIYSNISLLEEILREELENDLKYIKKLIEPFKYIEYDKFLELKTDNEIIKVPYNYFIIAQIIDKCNIIKSYNSWYDWCCDNWGCKSDISEVYDYSLALKYNAMSYDTPWGTNIVFILEISQRFKDITFTLQYIEEGMGFYGKAIIKDGLFLEVVRFDSSDTPFDYYKSLIEFYNLDNLEDVLFDYGIDDENLLNELCDYFELNDNTRAKCIACIENNKLLDKNA